jgi:hypothetical protein
MVVLSSLVIRPPRIRDHSIEAEISRVGQESLVERLNSETSKTSAWMKITIIHNSMPSRRCPAWLTSGFTGKGALCFGDHFLVQSVAG